MHRLTSCRTVFRYGVRAPSLRKFSQNSTKGLPPNKEQTAEVANSVWNRLWKNKILGAPLLLVAIVAVDIINIESHRIALESKFPSFVEFVRKYYGFDDEDPEERARVKFVSAQLESATDVLLADGTLISGVSGSKLVSEVVSDIASRNDQNLKNVESRQRLLEFDVKVTPKIDETEPSFRLFETKIDEQQPNGSTALISSLWAGEAPRRTTSVQIHELQHKANKECSNITIDKQVIESQYDNYLFEMIRGLRTLVDGGLTEIPILGKWNERHGAAKATRQHKANKVTQYDVERAQALMRIQELKYWIDELENEKKHGSMREVDVINSELAKKREELASLNRKYVNYFYFF